MLRLPTCRPIAGPSRVTCTCRSIGFSTASSSAPSSSTPPPSHDTATSLRRLMRATAQPVAVITCNLDPASPQTFPNHGATLSSLSSVSLSPPLVAFSLRMPSRLGNFLLSSSSSNHKNSGRIQVHLLSDQQEDLARAFARQAPLPAKANPSGTTRRGSPPGQDAFARSSFSPALFDRLRKEALGVMTCKVVRSVALSELEGDTPSIEKGKGDSAKSELFIARVENVSLGRTDRGSLVYWDQKYRSIGGT